MCWMLPKMIIKCLEPSIAFGRRSFVASKFYTHFDTPFRSLCTVQNIFKGPDFHHIVQQQQTQTMTMPQYFALYYPLHRK